VARMVQGTRTRDLTLRSSQGHRGHTPFVPVKGRTMNSTKQVHATGAHEAVQARGLAFGPGSTGPSALETHALSRETVLSLLSDDEVASVSTAETAAALADGDEYVDLQDLEQGVKRARGMAVSMGRILPRKAVHETTWTKILAELRGVEGAAILRPGSGS
jgi:hypothetical protein